MTRTNNNPITAAVCATAAQEANTRKRENRILKTKRRMAHYRKACLRAANSGKYEKKFFAGYTLLHWLFGAPSVNDFRCYLDPGDNYFYDGFEVVTNRLTVTVKWYPKNK
jgi:hypothetical protein